MTGVNEKIILECLAERIRGSKITEPFRLTTMEMRAFNLLLKQDIYDRKDEATQSTRDKMDLIYDKAIMLNYNVWCSNFNNSIKITIGDYFREFHSILDGIIQIKVNLNDSIGNLEELQMMKEMMIDYI